jgi:hypothetical protein
MVRIIPFLLDDIPPPESIIKSNKAQFWIWMVLNTTAGVLAGVFYNINWLGSNEGDDITYTITILYM